MLFKRVWKSISSWGMHAVEEVDHEALRKFAETPNPILDDIPMKPASLTDRLAKADPRTQPTTMINTKSAAAPMFGSERYLLMKVQRYAKHNELGLVAVLSEAETSPYAIVVTPDYVVTAVCYWSLVPAKTPVELKEPT